MTLTAASAGVAGNAFTLACSASLVGGPKTIDQLLTLLSTPPGELSKSDQAARRFVQKSYENILEAPFDPFAVARFGIVAFQYNVVMKYLDNLIAWGDSLFAQDTIESINDATLRYVLAANILGVRPEQVPEQGTVGALTFAKVKALAAQNLGGAYTTMGNVLVDLESQIPVRYRAAALGRKLRRFQPRERVGTTGVVFLRAAQRYAARLLGYGCRPAVQDPQLRETWGRQPAAVVRRSNRPGYARRGGGGRHRHREHREQPVAAGWGRALRSYSSRKPWSLPRKSEASEARCFRR